MSWRHIITAAIVSTTLTSTTGAQAVIIDVDSGAQFDAIIDGFPGIAAFDGEPDLGGNQLAAAFKVLVTEERGIAEFPLAALGDAQPGDIASATLTFNIDDVLSTFGPGTDFAGRAAHSIIVYAYAGDGTIDLADFKNIDSTPHPIDTTSHGTITDATLAQTGPLVFVVDIGEDLRRVLVAGATHLGIVWRSPDSPTGTSLDDLGDGSSGPPGTRGARLPFVTIDVAAASTPTPSATPTPTSTEPPPTATPTPTPTEPAPTPSDIPATSTPVATPTLPSVTDTATPTAPANVATPTPGAGCTGDCGEDGEVTIDELLTLVSSALGTFPPDACPPGDANRDGEISIDDLLAAVTTALQGCGVSQDRSAEKVHRFR